MVARRGGPRRGRPAPRSTRSIRRREGVDLGTHQRPRRARVERSRSLSSRPPEGDDHNVPPGARAAHGRGWHRRWRFGQGLDVHASTTRSNPLIHPRGSARDRPRRSGPGYRDGEPGSAPHGRRDVERGRWGSERREVLRVPPVPRADDDGPCRGRRALTLDHSTSRAFAPPDPRDDRLTVRRRRRYRSSNQAVGSPARASASRGSASSGSGWSMSRLCPAARRAGHTEMDVARLQCSGTVPRVGALMGCGRAACCSSSFNAWPWRALGLRRHRWSASPGSCGPSRDPAGPRGPDRRPARTPSDAGVLDRRGARGDLIIGDPAGHSRASTSQRLVAVGRDRARGATGWCSGWCSSRTCSSGSGASP
jgi:hypothetical protein